MPRARPEYTLIASLIGANLATTADQAMTMEATLARYVIKEIISSNASATPVLAAGGVYTATAKGGTSIVGAAQLYTALTAAAKWNALTLTAAMATDALSAAQLYLSLTTANGSACTCDIHVFGAILSN